VHHGTGQDRGPVRRVRQARREADRRQRRPGRVAHAWVKDINETQNTTVNFPILADADKKVATLYDMIHPNSLVNATVRSVFIIDPKKVIRTTLTYPASTGRNFDEILRVIDSLQLTDSHKVATPANWKQGDDVVIVPSIQDPKELAERFPKGFKAVRPTCA
jgi:alkyl hydroperoxide reductase subunit AhpC